MSDSGLVVYRDVDCKKLPDMELHRSHWHVLKAITAPPGFWTVGRYDNPRPLRTNREILTSKSFIIEEIVMWGVTWGSVQVTRNERQNPPIPVHGELYIDAYATTGVISVIHFVSRKYICQCVGDTAVAFTTAWRGYGMIKGYYE